jgi:O-antigen ligase
MLPEMQHRLQYVLTGRSEGSAEGRFLIWDRAATMLVAQAKLWGVGPDMFVVMDGHELHNDLLSFAVERGPLALLSLLLFGALACWRCVQTVRDGRALGARESVVFLAAVIGIAVESQTHELFHQRPVWLLLAFLEAVHWRQQAMLRSRAEPQLAALSAPMAAVRA